MEIAYISIKNRDALDGNLTVHLLITICYQKYGMVLCSFPSLLHNVYVYNRRETPPSISKCVLETTMVQGMKIKKKLKQKITPEINSTATILVINLHIIKFSSYVAVYRRTIIATKLEYFMHTDLSSYIMNVCCKIKSNAQRE